MKNLYLILLLGFSCSLFSCKDDDPTPPPSPPQSTIPTTASSRLLVNKSWKLASFTKSGKPENLVTELPACQKDNFYIFSQTAQLRVDEGRATCIPSTAGQSTWAFKDNEKVLNMSVPNLDAYGLAGDFDVDSLGASVLVLTKKDGTTSYKAIFNL